MYKITFERLSGQIYLAYLQIGNLLTAVSFEKITTAFNAI